MFVYMHMCLSIIYVQVSWTLIPWNWSYSILWATTSVLGIKPRSCGRATSTLNHWAISPVPIKAILISDFIQFFSFWRQALYVCHPPASLSWSARLQPESTLTWFSTVALSDMALSASAPGYLTGTTDLGWTVHNPKSGSCPPGLASHRQTTA